MKPISLIIMTLVFLSSAQGAEFFAFSAIDCNPMPQDILEAGICQSPRAVAQDQRIAAQLNDRIDLCDGIDSIKAHQKPFIVERNSCSKSFSSFKNIQNCVLKKQEQRLESLKSDDGYYCS